MNKRMRVCHRLLLLLLLPSSSSPPLIELESAGCCCDSSMNACVASDPIDSPKTIWKIQEHNRPVLAILRVRAMNSYSLPSCSSVLIEPASHSVTQLVGQTVRFELAGKQASQQQRLAVLVRRPLATLKQVRLSAID